MLDYLSSLDDQRNAANPYRSCKQKNLLKEQQSQGIICLTACIPCYIVKLSEA